MATLRPFTIFLRIDDLSALCASVQVCMCVVCLYKRYKLSLTEPSRQANGTTGTTRKCLRQSLSATSDIPFYSPQAISIQRDPSIRLDPSHRPVYRKDSSVNPKMNRDFTFFILLVLVCGCHWTLGSDPGSAVPRGVRPELTNLYLAAKDTFQCLDGSKAIPYLQINDDYCDCPDGSDEPGTSACGQSRFYCGNDGFQAKLLLSSRVNDGICDCCDGTDEWASGAPACPNTCFEMGRAAREEAERQAKIQAQGFETKKAMMQEGRTLKAEKQTELGDLEKELETVKKDEEVLEEEKNRVEETEKVFLDKHNALKEEQRKEREEAERQLDQEQAKIFFQEVDVNQDGVLHVTEIMANARFDQNQDQVVSDDEANFFMEGNTNYDLDAFLAHGWDLVKNQAAQGPPPVQTPPLEAGDEDLGRVGEDDDYPEYEGEPLDDDHAPDVEQQPEDIGSPQDQEEYDDETREAIRIADEARSKYEDARAKARDLEDRMNRVREFLLADYGEHGEFAPLKDKCFEYVDNEYIYKMCAFDYCSQKSKNGGGETRLGKWDTFEPVGNDKYAIMKFKNGQTCWNGPARSTTVRLQCGVEETVKAVSEPSKCEYEMVFETPAACSEPSATVAHDEL